MSRAAIRYAKAILNMAHQSGVAAEVNRDMEQIAETLASNAELNAFVNDPVIATGVKENALAEVFAASQPITKALFKLLRDNKRFELLADVARSYNEQFDALSGVEKVVVTTAVPLDEEMRSRVMSKVLGFSNKKITIENVVNPDILGGFILRMGDQQYNASVAARLSRLKRELVN